MSNIKISKSAKFYQERREPDLRNTRRQPGMHQDMSINAVHFLPLRPPYPTIPVLHDIDDTPPDAGKTKVWPWGLEGEMEIV